MNITNKTRETGNARKTKPYNLSHNFPTPNRERKTPIVKETIARRKTVIAPSVKRANITNRIYDKITNPIPGIPQPAQSNTNAQKHDTIVWLFIA